MPVWTVEFYPPSGQRDSPFDYIVDLDVNESASILHRLEVMADLPLENWPQNWTKKIREKVFQLTAGSRRVYYCLDESKLVVLHACKKAAQKARRRDIKRAIAHYHEYLHWKEDFK